MASLFPMQITESLSAQKAPFSEQQMEVATGSSSRAEQPIGFMEFHLSMQTTEQLWVAMEPSSEQLMEGTTG